MHPYLTIDLGKIEHNAKTITTLCRDHEIAVAGVTKGVCGDPRIAAAMLRGGVETIADSRLDNIERLAAAELDTSLMLLRIPPLSGAREVVACVDVSLNSELVVLEALSREALRRGGVHDAILMLDLGDRREGLLPGDLGSLVHKTLALPGIRIKGLGTNLSCFGGVVPSEENMSRLVELAEDIEGSFGLQLEWISGINSSGLELIASGRMPRRVNHARIGEAILLGRETVWRRPWPDTHQDAFVLHAEVLELKRKSSLPLGERGEDAFGQRPVFEDRGERLRALLNLGREDVAVEGLAPLDPEVSVIGASSGYLVVDVTDSSRAIQVGDELDFSVDYGALLAAMTSEYVKKRHQEN